MKDQKSTEKNSTEQQESSQTQTSTEKFYQALRGLEKVKTPLDQATEQVEEK